MKRSTIFGFACFLLGLVAGLGAAGYAQSLRFDNTTTSLRVEALGGQCEYGKVGHRVWYSDNYWHEMDMKAGCVFLGLSSIDRGQGRMHFGWRVGYTDLGVAKANGIYPTKHEDEITDGLNCDPVTQHGCLAKGFGYQTAKGVTAGMVVEFDSIGGSTLGLEGGAFVYYGRFFVDLDTYPVSTASPGAWRADWAGWHATPFIGATFRYGYLMGMARRYERVKAAEHDCPACSGVAGKVATQFLLGLSVPF